MAHRDSLEVGVGARSVPEAGVGEGRPGPRSLPRGALNCLRAARQESLTPKEMHERMDRMSGEEG